MTHRVFLLDDEPLAIKRLARMLEATARVTIVGEATDPEDALPRIRALAPAAAFLDISMPGLDGLTVARALPPSIAIVFTTAHDEHALRAFEVNAIDYLCKPIRADELSRALDKLDRIAAPAPTPGSERLASKLGDKVHLIDLERVTHFTAEDKLTYAVCGEKSFVIDATIAELEERYARAGYVRIHRATLVRLAAVAELAATPDGTRVRLADGKTELAVARDRVRALKDRLGVP